MALTAGTLLFSSSISRAASIGGTIAADAISFNRIVVSGHVKLNLIQDGAESISANESFDENRTSVKIKGYTLYINSTSDETVNLTVHLKDLIRITADRNASIENMESLKLKFLQVYLEDNAVANLNAKVGSIYAMLNDNTDLKLTGTTNELHLIQNDRARVDMTRFIAQNLEDQKSNTAHHQMTLSK